MWIDYCTSTKLKSPGIFFYNCIAYRFLFIGFYLFILFYVNNQLKETFLPGTTMLSEHRIDDSPVVSVSFITQGTL